MKFLFAASALVATALANGRDSGGSTIPSPCEICQFRIDDCDRLDAQADCGNTGFCNCVKGAADFCSASRCLDEVGEDKGTKYLLEHAAAGKACSLGTNGDCTNKGNNKCCSPNLFCEPQTQFWHKCVPRPTDAPTTTPPTTTPPTTRPPTTTPPTTAPPTTAPPTPCQGGPVPTSCALATLDDLLRAAFAANPERPAQFIRLAFHDAGTAGTTGGGAIGCLLTHPDFPKQGENLGLPIPVAALLAIKRDWEATSCSRVSNADLLQYAGLFAAVDHLPQSDKAAFEGQLQSFRWARPDAPVAACDLATVPNLPGFRQGSGQPFADRMAANRDEILNKMVRGNGFTEQEAVALIGAHTIGKTRTEFGASLAGPWVPNGDDSNPGGVVFDNAFFRFLQDDIPTEPLVVPDAVGPFNRDFSNWFQDTNHVSGIQLNWLDTDIALNHFFSSDVERYARDQTAWLQDYFAAYRKMGLLQVSESGLQDLRTC